MNTDIDAYFSSGCGRCPRGGTPDCKVHAWSEELKLLRELARDSELTEEVKWGIPCYTLNGKNVLTVSAFNDCASLSFFKGVLLDDPKKLLQKASENSQAAMLLRFTSLAEIEALRAEIGALILSAVAVEKSGKQVVFKKDIEPVPVELEEKFRQNPALRAAFEALTKGRQRGYILHFSAPKQAKTRLSRIEKCTEKILRGEGLHDKYN